MCLVLHIEEQWAEGKEVEERSRQHFRLEANKFLGMRDKDSLMGGPGHPPWYTTQPLLGPQPSCVQGLYLVTCFH